MICTYYSQSKKLEIELLKLITTRIIMKRVKSYFKANVVLIDLENNPKKMRAMIGKKIVSI